MKTTVLLSFILIIVGCKEEPLKTEITKIIPKEAFAIDNIQLMTQKRNKT